MTAIDTNVLLRYIVQDHPDQSLRASKLIHETIARGETVFVATVVLVETVWVLKSYYKLAKSDIAATVSLLLTEPGFELESPADAGAALKDYERLSGDFADYLLGHCAAVRHASPVHTFDRALGTSKLFRVLPSSQT